MLRDALAVFPANPLLVAESAELAAANSDWSTAEALWNELLTIEGENAEPSLYSRLSQAQRARGDYARAEQVIYQGLDLHPDHPALLTEVARIHMRRNDWDAATELLQRALATSVGRHSPGIYALLARAYCRADRAAEAEAMLQEALNSGDHGATFGRSGHLTLMASLTEIAVMREDWNTADMRWTGLMERYSAGLSPAVFDRIRRAYQDQGNIERAESILQQGLALHPEDPKLLEAWAHTASVRGDWQASTRRWEKIFEVLSSQMSAGHYAEAARAFRQSGDTYRAETILREGLKVFPRDVRLLSEHAVLENYASPAQELSVTDVGAPRPPAEIIVCVHNAFDETKECLEAVSARTHVNHFITIIDDASEPKVRTFLQDFAAKTPNCRLFVNQSNQGYTRSANLALSRARAEWVVLLNSDTLVTEYWLAGLLDCAKSDSAIRAVGPLSNAATFQSLPGVLGEEKTATDSESLELAARKIRMMSWRACPKVPLLNGFCLMLHKPTLDEVGYLDEKNFPRGYGEENDLCLRLLVAGYKLAIADFVFVYHSQSASFGSQRKALVVNAGDRLRRLWPGYTYSFITRVIEEIPALEQLRTAVPQN